MQVGDRVIEHYDDGDREHRTAVVVRLKTYRGVPTGDFYVKWDDGASPRVAILARHELRLLSL